MGMELIKLEEEYSLASLLMDNPMESVSKGQRKVCSSAT